MNKCRNCGKEFEGKFCPDCGEKVLQPIFEEEFATNPQAEATAEGQHFDLKSLGKKKLLQLRFVSNLTERIYGILLFAIVLFYFTVLVLLSITVRNGTMSINDKEIITTAKPYIIIASVLGSACIISIATFIIMLKYKRPIINYSQLQTRRKQYKKCGAGVMAIILLVIFEGFHIAACVNDAENVVILFITIFYPILIIAYLAIPYIGIKIINKFEKEYVITDADGNIEDNLTLISNVSIQEIKNIKTMRVKECNEKREAMGQAPKTAREVERQDVFKDMYRKISTAAVLIIFASLIFILSISFSFLRINFDIEKIEKLSVGDNLGYITRILGDPYDKKENKDTNGILISGTYYFCDSSLAKDIVKINKKLEKLENADDLDDLEEMIELSEKLANLEEELAKTRCNYVTVDFDNYKVTSISFAKDRYNGGSSNSKISKITYSNADGKKYYKYGNTITGEKGKEEITVNARLYFGDGSLLNKQIKVKLNSGQTGVQNLTWSDSFGTHEIIVNLI